MRENLQKKALAAAIEVETDNWLCGGNDGEEVEVMRDSICRALEGMPVWWLS